MEVSFLYAIPRTPALDSFFLGLTKTAGSYGHLWVIVAFLLLTVVKLDSVWLVLMAAAFGILFGRWKKS